MRYVIAHELMRFPDGVLFDAGHGSVSFWLKDRDSPISHGLVPTHTLVALAADPIDVDIFRW